MSYPKKPSYDRLEPPSEDKIYREGKAACHDQFTKEIFKRTEVEELADIIDDKLWEDARSAIDSPEPVTYYLAQALQQHIREGLKEAK